MKPELSEKTLTHNQQFMPYVRILEDSTKHVRKYFGNPAVRF